jgi:NADP-dependent 3-hydroxy acid dehydrogenase YdfG
MTAQSPKTWLITGASRGFGRQWAIAALDRGDQVAATARRLADVAALSEQYGDQVLAAALDVTDRDAAFSVVRQAASHFGRLDVAVNNAGYGHFAMVEELSEHDVRAQMEANFFGALWVTQAALPIMRAQRSGHLLQVTSLGGITAFPGIGAYHASKWALEGLSQSLAAEAAAFWHQDHHDRARRLRHRLARPVLRQEYGKPGIRNGAPGTARRLGRPARRPGRHPGRHPQGRRRREPVPAYLLRQGTAGGGHPRLRIPPRHLAAMAAAVRRGIRPLTGAQGNMPELPSLLRERPPAQRTFG